MKQIIILGLILSYYTAYAQREKNTVNSNWEFFKGSVNELSELSTIKEWEKISIPHNWNIEDMIDDELGYYRGTGFYKKSLYFSSADKNKRLYLYFEAANQDATVYLNGQKVGEHRGGYTAFSFDITPNIVWDKQNALLVKVSNQKDSLWLPLSGDLAHYGGIYRDVYVIKTNQVHFDMNNHASSGVFVKTVGVKDNKPKVIINGTLENDSKENRTVIMTHDINDKTGKLITTLTQKLSLKPGSKTAFELQSAVLSDIQLWSPEEPNLYTVVSTIRDAKNNLLDEIKNPLGFRYFSVDNEKGFFLNGKHCFIRGVGRHQDYTGVGFAASNEVQIIDVHMAKEMGLNLLKSHYPQDPVVWDECDKKGLMMIGRIPFFDEITYGPEFITNTKYLLNELVLQNYNHPSVIIWEVLNEAFGGLDWYWSKPQDPVKMKREIDEMKIFCNEIEKYSRELDPERLTVSVFHADPTPELYRDAGLTNVSMINGWNIYHGWYHESLQKLGSVLDRFRSFAPSQPFMIAEFGPGSDLRIHTDQPTIFDFSIEYQNMFHKHYLAEVANRPWILGMCIWTWSDFQVDHRGDVMPHINNKGMLTCDRKKKDAFYLFKSHWNPEPMIHIAGKDWLLRKEITHGKNYVVKPIKIFTNLESIELFINGVSMGLQKAIDKEVSFNVIFKEGITTLVAKGKDKEKLIEDVATIQYSFQPEMIDNNFNELCVNVGQSRTYFFDPNSQNQWLPDQEYKTGSWGHKNGNYYRIWNDMKAWQGIREGVNDNIKKTDLEPVYQTFLIGLNDYQFDVPNGTYEIELYLTEPFNKERRLKPSDKTGADIDGNRIFDVNINNKTLIKNLNIASEYGEQIAVKEVFVVKADNKQGISLKLIPIKGEPILSGIRLRKL